MSKIKMFFKAHKMAVFLVVSLLLLIFASLIDLKIEYNKHAPILLHLHGILKASGIITFIAVEILLICYALKGYKLLNRAKIRIPWHKKIYMYIMDKGTTIFFVIVSLTLTVYVICNWDLCISMEFFKEFDGNNVLFMSWIILIFLTLYDIEGKGIKVKRHKDTVEDLKKQLDSETDKYVSKSELEKIKQNLEQADSLFDSQFEKGESDDGRSN